MIVKDAMTHYDESGVLAEAIRGVQRELDEFRIPCY